MIVFLPTPIFNSRPHGGRLIADHTVYSGFNFNSTPSRRATTTFALNYGVQWISTHALTEGDLKRQILKNLLNISTHALTEGEPNNRPFIAFNDDISNSQPSRRATTHTCTGATPAKDFNSRPHGGRRSVSTYIPSKKSYFNSRPHGGRRLTLLLLYFGVIFQLTPSRRATTVNVSSLIVTVISTHALTEGDELLPACAEPAEKFQLTPSRRATITLHARLHFHFISTHALTEGDSTLWPTATSIVAFQLTPSRRATVLRLDVRKL